MHLINSKILAKRFATFDFPTGDHAQQIERVLAGWQKALKDHDLERTKETSIQGQFLQKFFGEILGYTLQTEGNNIWNLIQHPSSEVDAQEPDGSLGFFSRNDPFLTRAVIELKDAKTSLDKRQSGRQKGYTPIEQAYLYATKFDRCNWIIVSNFREIRLYNRNRTQEFYEKFDVLDLHKEAEFKRFYYLLCKQNLLAKTGESTIDYLANDTSAENEDITRKLYVDYKNARFRLFNHLIEHNPTVPKLALLEKSQKILDRIIFILFCEDTGNLLPRNTLKDTYELGIRSRERSDERVWREFKNLFMDIDVGRQDINPKINRYNGGLFANDEQVNNLSIKDEVWEPLVALNMYDFESDVDVNILGHIFEQSISDLEAIKESINLLTQNGSNVSTESGDGIILEQEAVKFVEKSGRRKKEGIFYTPDYVTHYIINSVLGNYLETNPNRLESIKILDPACGSGAFLNQAHTFLMDEYKARYEQKMLEKQNEQSVQQLDFSDLNLAETNKSILLNNLYGVDLNQESVEITKLSLWLKTARPSEPLQNLDATIKCGNSLVSNATVDTKAFNWDEEYKEILASGGFDVIIGNPPYINSMQLTKMMGEEVKPYWKHNYESAVGTYDIYVLFFEQAIRLLKPGGYLGFITPNKFLSSPYGEGIRKYIKQTCQIVEVFDLSTVKVFSEPSVYPVVTILRKEQSAPYQLEAKVSRSANLIEATTKAFPNTILDILPNSMFSLIIAKHPELVEKVFKITNPLVDFAEVNATSTAAESDAFSKHIDEDESRGKKLVNTGTIDPYMPLWGIREMQNKGHKYLKPMLQTEKLTMSPHRKLIYDAPKIIVAKVATKIEAFLDTDGSYASLNTNCIYNPKKGVSLEYLLGVLNSTLMSLIYEECFGALRMSGGFLQFQAPQLRVLPIVAATDEQQQAISKNVRALMKITSKLYHERKYAADMLQEQYKLNHVSERLKTIDKLGWNEFVEELEKLKVGLLLSQKDEAHQWFRKKVEELTRLAGQIKTLQECVDTVVCDIYNLTEKEKEIVQQKSMR
jgi:type I restriction-modification system DNA methylase subunit